jgi:hypothetical protein
VKRLNLFSRIFGLHPLAALMLITVDWVLFGEEIITGGAGWLISLPVGLALGLATIKIQKHAHKDETSVATAKGVVAGILTAIPAPLSSLGLLPMAAFGLIRAVFPKQSQAPTNGLPQRDLQPRAAIVPKTLYSGQAVR